MFTIIQTWSKILMEKVTTILQLKFLNIIKNLKVIKRIKDEFGKFTFHNLSYQL